VHLIRHSLEFVSWKDRKLVVPALKAIYRAKNAEAGLKALAEFETSFWGQRYPAIAQSWQRNWEHVVPFFAYPESVRRIIYTTNAIEALNAKLRRAVRARGHFPNDDAVIKLLWLAIRDIEDKRARDRQAGRPAHEPAQRAIQAGRRRDRAGLERRLRRPQSRVSRPAEAGAMTVQASGRPQPVGLLPDQPHAAGAEPRELLRTRPNPINAGGSQVAARRSPPRSTPGRGTAPPPPRPPSTVP